MTRQAPWRAAIVIAALLLLWRILAVNAVLVDERGRNRIADGDPGRVARSALQDNPAEATALLALAVDDERSGRPGEAMRKLAAARELAPSMRETLEQSAGFLLRQGRYTEAVDPLDRLAEQHRDYEGVFPVLATMLVNRDPAWDALQSRNPGWLGDFITAQCAKAVDPSLLVPLLQRRIGTGQARSTEIECITRKLRVSGRWEQAYQVWLNALPPERLANVGYVFNGGFEFPASGIGFDWITPRGPERETGHAVEFVSGRGGTGTRTLRVAFNGKRQATPPIRQYLVVPAGRYRLSGRGRADALSSARGVQWTVRCAADESATPLAASERFLGSSEWREFGFEVTIPPGCPGQLLQLEPVGMELGTTFLAGAAWFDDLVLARQR